MAACSLKSSPPVIMPALIKVNWAKRSISFRVCCASSRVGSSTRARISTRFCFRSTRRLSTGSTKAAVLPLPVFAVTRRSRPCKARGMAAACTGVGSSKFNAATALSRRSCRANWENTGVPRACAEIQPYRVTFSGAHAEFLLALMHLSAL
ncbi:hypothetical protein D3C72_1695390 [compost metagenome]